MDEYRLKNENFDPWYPHIYYPSVIINQFNDTLLNEETEIVDSDNFVSSNLFLFMLYKLKTI